MIQYPSKVEYLYGWNLLITFRNGEKRVYNCDDIPNSTKKNRTTIKKY